MIELLANFTPYRLSQITLEQKRFVTYMYYQMPSMMKLFTIEVLMSLIFLSRKCIACHRVPVQLGQVL